MPVNDAELNEVFDELDEDLIATLTASAIVAHMAGDLKAQKAIKAKVPIAQVRSAAASYGEEYKRLLVERGGGYIVNDAGQFEFKNWFAQSTKANREKVADIINTGISEGKGIRETKKDLAEFFTQRKNHAELVARTETAKIQSIAASQRRLDQGIENEQWKTAEDERVRHAHAERHDKVYPTGTMFVGEPNCRCSLIGYVEEV